MNVFNKYIWLVNTLRRYHYGATLEQLRHEWYDSELNVDQSELNARTFFRWKEGVQDQFGIIIECDAARGYKYYIENDSRLEQDRTTSWMLHTVTVSNIIEEFKGHKDKIILEEVPSGEEYLIQIMKAIKSCSQLQLVYHKFDEAEARPETTINPLCLRLFNRRWYAVIDYVEPEKRRVIALDRIEELTTSKQKFNYPKDFDAQEYFMFDYGIAVGFDEEPCFIHLKINKQQRPYTRALPLHESQKEIEITDDYSVFEYYLKPSNDFARAILPFGQNYEVLKPKELKEKVKLMAYNILKNNE
ncbi:MAG: WYL domain-containing protein [Muribaculaceae bacterium]|nr:WYL domain-containing protein [Muribaculaceae bacterium]